MSIYVDINRDNAVGVAEARDMRIPIIAVSAASTLWFLAVVVSAYNGWFSAMYQPIVALIVAATIIIPFAFYKISSGFRNLVDEIGHRRIVIFHIWRIPAAFAFFWYGLNGMLPPIFWILAGVGDLLVGIYALRLSFATQSAATYAKFHRVGFADFVLAVGTGLTFTLLMDIRMAPIATLPLALIPLFGVGISGASHLMAFDLLKHRAGFGAGDLRAVEDYQQSRWSALSNYWAALADNLDYSRSEIQGRQIGALAKRVQALEDKVG